jgi:hypothetical protein
VLKTYGGSERQARGRHKNLDISQKIDLHYGMEADKMRRYCELLRALFVDQLAWLRDRSHQRISNEDNARNSLAMAAAATVLAESSS